MSNECINGVALTNLTTREKMTLLPKFLKEN